MARNEMLKIKQIEGLSEILTGTAVSGPSDEIIIGAGLSEPLTSSINFRYNITDGLFVGSGGLRVADFGGSGSQMVVVDNTGVFSVQDIPTEATLTSTYIGFGSPTGFLTGSADLTWSGSTFKIGSASPAYTGNLNVIGAAGSASAISIGVQNTSSDGWSHLMLNQDSANYGYIGKYGTTYGSAHPGTSISYNNNLVVASSSLSADGTAPLSMIGSILYGITGVTSSNFGYRLDTTGLRVGRLSTLHTANTYPFEVGIDGTYKTIFTGTSLAFAGGYTSSIVNRSTDSSFGNPLGNGAFEISSGSTAGFVLGTISNTPLVFATNNIERLRVEATGNAVLSGTAAVHRQYRINIPEDIGTAGGLLIWSSGNNETYLRRSYDSGNLDGTSIPYYHNTILSSKKSGAQFNGEITIGGNTIYNVVGTTSSNYGTRLDSVGLKIGILSSLHTAGVAPFQIGTGLYASAAMMSIGAVLSGGYNGSYGIYNSRANAAGVLNRHFVGESAANSVGTIAAFELRNYNDVTSRFVNYANAGTSLLSGTSINLASSLRIDNTIGTYSNSLSSSGKILLTGSEIYAISGSTATNYGFRADAAGFRIGQLSTLHTSNSYVFSIEGGLTYRTNYSYGRSGIVTDAQTVIDFNFYNGYIRGGTGGNGNIYLHPGGGGVYIDTYLVPTYLSMAAGSSIQFKEFNGGYDHGSIGYTAVPANSQLYWKGKLRAESELRVTAQAGTGDRLVQADANGIQTASTEIVAQYVTDSTVRTQLETPGNWDINFDFIGSPGITGTYQGQMHYDNNYLYMCVADDVWIRLTRG